MDISTKLKLLVITLLTTILASACGTGATPTAEQDAGAIQTQAMQVVATQFVMQQTQTAAVVPASSPSPLPTTTLGPVPTFPTFGPVTTPGAGSPSPFNTPAAGFTPLASPLPTIAVGVTVGTANGCNDGLYIGETAPYDMDVLKAGASFSKAWQIENTGTCTWGKDYVFAFLPEVSSPELKGYNIVINADEANHTLPKHSQTFVVKLTAPETPGEYFGYWKLQDASGNSFGPRVYVDIVVQ